MLVRNGLGPRLYEPLVGDAVGYKWRGVASIGAQQGFDQSPGRVAPVLGFVAWFAVEGLDRFRELVVGGAKPERDDCTPFLRAIGVCCVEEARVADHQVAGLHRYVDLVRIGL